MKSLEDLIEEAKLRTVWWILCIFAVCYFMTHTSKSMLMNFPIAILFVFGLRFLFNEVDFRWKVRSHHPKSYLSHLEKKQLSVNDYRLTSQPAPQRWRRKIDSPIVEAAIEDFVNKIVHDFVTDLWYSEITPDKEAPELMHSMVMDALGEVCGRVKEINLVELLTKNVVDLVGDHLDLFRMNQAAIGVDVMATLSFEEKDDRLKHHLLESKELHPALISPESEYKVLQRITGGILAVVLRTRDAQSPLVRCIARELLTCLVIQPLLNFASPVYINELIECIISYNIDGSKDAITEQLIHTQIHSGDLAVSDEQDQVIGNLRKYMPSSNYVKFMSQSSGQSVLRDNFGSDSLNSIWDETSDIVNPVRGEPVQARHAEWAKEFEAVTQRRSEVLTPENLENMWAIGRNYKKKLQQAGVGEKAAGLTSSSSLSSQLDGKYFSGEVPNHKPESSTRNEDKNYVEFPPRPQLLNTYSDLPVDALHRLEEVKEMIFEKESSAFDDVNSTSIAALEKRNKHKRSSSTSDVKIFSKVVDDIEGKSRVPIINEYYSADFQKINVHNVMSRSDMVLSHERLNAQKFKCRVVGAYFEKIGSNSFAVYSISVTDSGKKTWSVKRRYRNFERLHRQLKNIPNYTLHLPPKRIFSSSTEDAFVHQRCIQLDKYLQDLLSIANVAEQHEVWDFFSATSKNYSFGNSASVMKTLAVNVDDAKDDIFRQFKGVSDSLTWKGSGSSSSLEQDATAAQRHLSWNADEPSKSTVIQTVNNSMINYSDNDEVDKDADNGEANFEAVIPAVEMISNQVNFSKRGVAIDDLNFKEIHSSRLRSEPSSLNSRLEALPPLSSSVVKEDPSSAPLEWSPPNLSVPILNLVDKVFQLNRRGWIRRQVYWISKQILQLIMEDAIDDWLSSQIQWLRREDVIAQGIHWVKDVLWPNGTFFLKLRPRGPLGDSEAAVGAEEITKLPGETRGAQPGTFEQQLEAARRASYVKNMIFNGAPSPLVGLIGQNQYRRSARDIYYFLQSTICLKQLSYGILEIFVISVFPELRDLITDIHKMNA